MANPDFGAAHVKEIEDKTAGAIDQYGWLHSGDKELIIGAGGENIAPVPVEEELKLQCPAVANVMMVGDNRKYNVALISLQAEGATGEFPGGDNLAGVALEVNPKVKKISEAMKDKLWIDYIQ